MITVSVVIPTFNEGKNIQDCLLSLDRQTHSGFEVIVVDDGSSDKTVEVLSKIRIRHYRLHILFQSHKGPGAARNFGAKKAVGKILVFVDADMIFDSDFIKKLTDPIYKGTTIGTFSKEEYLANKNNRWAVCWNLNRGLPKDRMLPDNYPDYQKVFRAILREEFERVKGFDEKAGYTDDWSLSDKLGIEANNAPGAKFFHKNPDTLAQILIQSKWMAKRKYRLGWIGVPIALVRVCFPISVIAGLWISFRHALPQFIIFKIISDWGQFWGLLEFIIVGKVNK